MTGTVLWLAGLAALSLLAAAAIRRVARLAGGTRELERFQAGVVRAHEQLAGVVDPLVGRLDEVRRGARDPVDLAADLDAARARLRDVSRDAKALRPPPALAVRAAELAWELDRAVRAADMAGHGIHTMGEGRVRRIASTEAEVALKRGTLGLRHARDAVTRVMMGVARLTPADVRALPAASADRRSALLATPPADDDILGGGFEEPPA